MIFGYACNETSQLIPFNVFLAHELEKKLTFLRKSGIYVGLLYGGGKGKDPMNVERSASYAARYAAKNIVAAELADKCEMQLTYVMGLSRPASIMINTFGTGKYADEILSRAVEEIFDFRPAVIIEELKLCRPMYRTLAKYGGMGREDLQVQWRKQIKQMNYWNGCKSMTSCITRTIKSLDFYYGRDLKWRNKLPHHCKGHIFAGILLQNAIKTAGFAIELLINRNCLLKITCEY